MDNLSLGVNSTVATNNLAIQCMNSDSLPSKVLKITAYSIIMTVSILGNTALALVYFKERNMKNTINLCVMNMVFSDVLVTLIYMPRVMNRVFVGDDWLVGGTAGLILCKLVSLSQEVSICVSVLTIVIVAFERFLAVVFPLRARVSKRVSLGLLCGTWLSSLAARSPMLHAVRIVRLGSGQIRCEWVHSLSFNSDEARKSYHKFMLIAFYALPLCCIMVLYAAIFVILNRRGGLVDNRTRNRTFVTNRKVTRMALAVITTFLLCWLLYFLVLPLEEICKVAIPCNVHFLRYFMGHANSACNPIICMVFNENYRNGIKNIICIRKKRNNKHPHPHPTGE